jgi:uncharacterized phage protein (TIGR02220 family)
MARIRTIKPSFWVSEQVMSCSIDARLFFIGLWTFADDSGVIKNSPMSLKAQIFPGDNMNSTSIRRIVDELYTNKLLMPFSDENGEQYLYILNWAKHQKIDKSLERLKAPPLDLIKDFISNSTSIRRTFDEHSTSARDGIGIGIGIGIGEKTDSNESLSDSHRTSRLLKEKSTEQAIEVLNFLNEKAEKFYRPVEVNLKLINRCLSNGMSVEDLKCIIAKKCREWKGNPTMDYCLRPKTLFSKENCEQYYGQLNLKLEQEVENEEMPRM